MSYACWLKLLDDYWRLCFFISGANYLSVTAIVELLWWIYLDMIVRVEFGMAIFS